MGRIGFSKEAEESKTNADGKDELWLICPICKHPNPSGTLHCKYCWGPSLYTVNPITSSEMIQVTRQIEAKQKTSNVIRTIIIAIVAPLLLVSAVFFWLYSFTDYIFAPPAQLNSSSLPGQATMFRYNITRTGSTDVGNVMPQGVVKWIVDTGSISQSTPAVVNGTVYFGAQNNLLYAVSEDTGKISWSFKAGSWVGTTPAVVDGVVYFGSNDGKLYALDAKTGHKLWEFNNHMGIMNSPAVADGLVFFGGDDYSVYALDAKTGKQIWKFKTQGHMYSSPVVANGIVYIGSNDGFIYALNAVNGRFRLKFAGREVISSPAVDNGIVYYTSGSYMYAINGKARNWPLEFQLRPWWLELYLFSLAPPPPPISGYYWVQGISYVTSNTTPVIVDNNIFASVNNSLVSIDIKTRKVTFLPAPWKQTHSSLAYANGIFYAGSDEGKIYAVDGTSGKKIWEVQTGGRISSSPTFCDGVLYVTSEDGKLYAIH